MASSSTDVNLFRAKELGKYRDADEPLLGKPHEKSRILAAEDVGITRVQACATCNKHMSKVKAKLVCSCKKVIHCSKDCLKSSPHKCREKKSASKEKYTASKEELPAAKSRERQLIDAFHQRYMADREASRGPSSEKMGNFLKMTRNDHRRILNHAEHGNAMAAYVIGSAYADRTFDRKDDFAIPRSYKEKSVAETDEIAVKWLQVAAEAGVPEAMLHLFIVLAREEGLRGNTGWFRVAYDWLVQAHATKKMDYLIQLLETPMWSNLPSSLHTLYNQVLLDAPFLHSQFLAALLLATRYRELIEWDGKTAMGEPFYGRAVFKSIIESVGELKNGQSVPSFINGENRQFYVISARPGNSDLMEGCYKVRREENNLKFRQGVKEKNSPDSCLADQTSNIEGRTKYLITCKHGEVQKYMAEKAYDVQVGECAVATVGWETDDLEEDIVDVVKLYKSAGECESCCKEAEQRLQAVSLGLFSISLFPMLQGNLYAARYSNEDGVIVQDVFEGYAKPYIRQMLQCLMSNPADLHPLAVAEVAHLFWPIIWFWGSVYQAVEDTCNKTTLDSIYHILGENLNCSKSENVSAMAAFPESAAGEWRIACGSENCPRVDHEVKFSICKGCNVRRYCNEKCQKEDWSKHSKFCRAAKEDEK